MRKPIFILSLTLIAIAFTAFTTIKFSSAATEQNRESNQGQTVNQEQNLGVESVGNLSPTATSGKDEKDKELPGRASGQINAQEHRSEVANFVQSLVQVANRQKGGIGQQVRVIAQEQNQSASTTIGAMEKVQKRNKIKTFLFGSDYKNLGALRSELVQTRNRIRQLNRIMAEIQNEGDRIQLRNQIQTLEQEQEKIENFIIAQEGKFSLFGWLVKLFSS